MKCVLFLFCIIGSSDVCFVMSISRWMLYDIFNQLFMDPLLHQSKQKLRILEILILIGIYINWWIFIVFWGKFSHGRSKINIPDEKSIQDNHISCRVTKVHTSYLVMIYTCLCNIDAKWQLVKERSVLTFGPTFF